MVHDGSCWEGRSEKAQEVVALPIRITSSMPSGEIK